MHACILAGDGMLNKSVKVSYMILWHAALIVQASLSCHDHAHVMMVFLAICYKFYSNTEAM